MKLAIALMMLSTVATPSRMAGQATEPDQTPPANSSTATPAPSQAQVPVQQPSPAFDRPVSWKLLVPNIVSDQERIWLFPTRLTKKRTLIPTLAILGTTAALIALDPHDAPYFRRTSSFSGFNSVFSGNATAIGTLLTPVSFYGAGLFLKDPKMRGTALLAGEAVGDVEILATALKDATKRVRPAAVPANGNFSDTWFESKGSFLRGNGSLPSGHTIAAFSIATIVARRYGNHRWVPYVSYGMAALVGFSRLTLSAHFVSDVFVGAALGYSVSRFAVLRQ
jgi:membrane-associated phospholipid phosphatase